MKDKNLTDTEIKKALENWIKNYEGTYGNFRTLGLALDLINRLQAELTDKEKQLQKALKSMAVNKTKVIDCEREIDCQKSEIERLKETNKNMSAYVKGNNWGLVSFVEFCKNLKAEAYKEFAEELNKIEKFRSLVESDNYELSVTMREVDNLLKELVGDK